jgi:hypothetical protein
MGSQFVKVGAIMAMAALAGALQAADTRAGYAKVRYVVGSPMVAKGGGSQWQPLEKDSILRTGDVIKTDDKSHVDVMLGYNNGSFQVAPSSELAFDKLQYTLSAFEVTHDTQLNLKSGKIGTAVRKMAPASKYEVKTTRGVAGVRGTRASIAASGDTTVAEGVVVQSLMMPDNTAKTFTIKKGMTLVAASGQLRDATPEEIKLVDQIVADALTHGGFIADQDPLSRRFFLESQFEPYLPPVSTAEQPYEPPVSPRR